ncbi:hypothetical protein RBG61_01440 [Paludicola sp. MB14-C6]|uniref:hypothetical protein n=1 Tax=Paludihabitans sp. MB14-C6 TaxID=3070656 RepID=UPI0027DBE33F|nr:hypothetical protein [Paludicola sp. MB14-C6]WMJ23353.1 hypothetical protein RBG61_01440 [Paludicola sp. MB14-C6]
MSSIIDELLAVIGIDSLVVTNLLELIPLLIKGSFGLVLLVFVVNLIKDLPRIILRGVR